MISIFIINESPQRANLSEKNVLLVMQHICLYCTGANASNTAANQTDLSLWDTAAAVDQGLNSIHSEMA